MRIESRRKSLFFTSEEIRDLYWNKVVVSES